MTGMRRVSATHRLLSGWTPLLLTHTFFVMLSRAMLETTDGWSSCYISTRGLPGR